MAAVTISLVAAPVNEAWNVEGPRRHSRGQVQFGQAQHAAANLATQPRLQQAHTWRLPWLFSAGEESPYHVSSQTLLVPGASYSYFLSTVLFWNY